MYEERTYRNLVRTDDLVNFEVIVKETDLLIRAERDLSKEARESILKYRNQLETYIAMHPEFVKSLVPLDEDPYAPEMVREMIRTSALCHVGPMAAVAGAMAEFVSRDLMKVSKQVIVENGGDIYLATSRERMVGIYAGTSPLSMKLGITHLRPKILPWGFARPREQWVPRSALAGRMPSVSFPNRRPLPMQPLQRLGIRFARRGILNKAWK